MEVIAVTNRKLCREDFFKRIERLYKSGVSEIILREKDLSDEEYYALAKKCFEICGDKLCINSRSEIAKELNLKKIQLSLKSFTEKDTYFTETGVSVHSLADAVCAEKTGADRLIGGHIFQTGCKPGLPPRGVGFIREIAASVKIPVYAIGGISPGNAALLKGSGIKGVCLMSSLMAEDRPEELVSFFNSLQG